MSDNSFEAKLKEAIEAGKQFTLKFYVLDDYVEKNLNTALKILFSHYGKNDISDIIYQCVKELVINGSKANLKRIFFKLNNLDINNPDDYKAGIKKFKEELSDRNYYKHLKELKENELWVCVKFSHTETGIKLEVINNTKITEIENKRLREKLKTAMQYDDLTKFYNDHIDDEEGAGAGVAMIVLLLRGLKIDPNLFWVSYDSEHNTCARLEIPMSSKYISEREFELLNMQMKALSSQKKAKKDRPRG